METETNASQQDFCDLMDEMTRSVSLTRELIKSLRDKWGHLSNELLMVAYISAGGAKMRLCLTSRTAYHCFHSNRPY